MALQKDTSASHRISAFVSFQHADFRWMCSGQLISEIGTQMQMVAINWHIYILTHSAVALGMISLARLVPLFIFSLVGGVYADAHDRRKILLTTQSSMMILAGLLAFFNDLGAISVALIYAISAALAAATSFDGPAWQATIPNLVPKEHLMNALSLHNIVKHAAMIVGPALAGFVIAWKGVSAVYLINMVSFVAVLAAVIGLKTPSQARLGMSRVTLQAMREGIQFVLRSEVLFSTTLLDFFSTFFSSATALLPIFAKDILLVGPQGLGILHAGRSVGGIMAATGMSFVGNVRKKGRLVLYAVTVYAAATALFGGSRWFIVSFLALVLVGAGDTVSAIMRQNIRQLETPDYLRGRMNSVTQLFFIGGPQLGNLEAGLAAALIGAPWSAITGGAANLLYVGIAAKKYPKLRKYES